MEKNLDKTNLVIQRTNSAGLLILRYMPKFHCICKLTFRIFFLFTPCGLGRSPARLYTLRYGFSFWRQSTWNNCARETWMGEKRDKHCFVEVGTRETPLCMLLHMVNRILCLCVAFLNTPIHIWWFSLISHDHYHHHQHHHHHFLYLNTKDLKLNSCGAV